MKRCGKVRKAGDISLPSPLDRFGQADSCSLPYLSKPHLVYTQMPGPVLPLTNTLYPCSSFLLLLFTLFTFSLSFLHLLLIPRLFLSISFSLSVFLYFFLFYLFLCRQYIFFCPINHLHLFPPPSSSIVTSLFFSLSHSLFISLILSPCLPSSPVFSTPLSPYCKPLSARFTLFLPCLSLLYLSLCSFPL